MFPGSIARLIVRITSSPVAELVVEVLHLALADAMLAGAGAVHGDGAEGEPADEGLGAAHLVGIFDVDQHGHMEIAVADMADDRRDAAARARCRPRSR